MAICSRALQRDGTVRPGPGSRCSGTGMGSRRPIIPGPGWDGIKFQKYSGTGSGTVCNFKNITGRDPGRDDLLRDRDGTVILLQDSSTEISRNILEYPGVPFFLGPNLIQTCKDAYILYSNHASLRPL